MRSVLRILLSTNGSGMLNRNYCQAEDDERRLVAKVISI